MPNVAPDCTALCETGQRDCEAYLPEKTTRLVLRRGRDSRPVWGKSPFFARCNPRLPIGGSAYRVCPSEGRAFRIRVEGPACQVRCTTLDYRFRFGGHDKHAPPILPSEGRACRVRWTTTALPAMILNSLNEFRFLVLRGCAKYLKLPILRTNRIFRKCRNNFLARCRTS